MKRFGWFLATALTSAAALAQPARPEPRLEVPAPDGAPEAAQPAPLALEVLATPVRLRALCLATRPVERVFYEGDEVARGEAKAAYAAARESAFQKLYRVRVPASGFRLGEYDPKEGRLALDLARTLRTLHGALTLAIPSDTAVGFLLAPDNARNAAAAQKAGLATLDAYFELSDENGAVCSGSSAAEIFTIAAEPVAFELRDGMGQLLGRDEMPLADKHRAELGGYSGKPVSIVGAVALDGAHGDAAGIARRLASGVQEPVRRCYAQRLETAPSVSGTVVVGVETAADGKVTEVEFIANALRDEAVQKCIDEAIRAVRFQGASLFRVPIELKLVPR